VIDRLLDAVPSFLIALFCAYLALEYAQAPRITSTWGVSRELWPKIYNARVLQLVALALAAYAGMHL
jgi:hypothetical protein